jgi:hypothetical protein
MFMVQSGVLKLTGRALPDVSILCVLDVDVAHWVVAGAACASHVQEAVFGHREEHLYDRLAHLRLHSCKFAIK